MVQLGARIRESTRSSSQVYRVPQMTRMSRILQPFINPVVVGVRLGDTPLAVSRTAYHGSHPFNGASAS